MNFKTARQWRRERRLRAYKERSEAVHKVVQMLEREKEHADKKAGERTGEKASEKVKEKDTLKDAKTPDDVMLVINALLRLVSTDTGVAYKVAIFVASLFVVFWFWRDCVLLVCLLGALKAVHDITKTRLLHQLSQVVIKEIKRET